MCQINFSIIASDTDGSVLSGEGRYRIVGSHSWSQVFTIADINSATTPDILSDGIYELQVRVRDNRGLFSPWTTVDGFSVGRCTLYSNVESTVQVTKNDCPTGQAGSTELYTLVAGTYTSEISQADADQQALAARPALSQAYANEVGTCTVINVQYRTPRGVVATQLEGTTNVAVTWDEPYEGPGTTHVISVSVNGSNITSIAGAVTDATSIVLSSDGQVPFSDGNEYTFYVESADATNTFTKSERSIGSTVVFIETPGL